MRSTKRVILEFSYDDEVYTHPSSWNWAAVLDLASEDDVHRAEIFSLPTVEL